MFAPAQLSLAPRPLPDELLSSWLLRIAAAQVIPFAELMEGMRRHHPENLLSDQALDYAVPEKILQALSHWTRVPYAKLYPLDLKVRLPQMNPALLLRFSQASPVACPQGRSWRVRYAFCPSCVCRQRIFHIRWYWCLAVLGRCAIHQCSLVESCFQCGDLEPIRFSPPGTRPSLRCRSCGQDLEPLSSVSHPSGPDDPIGGVLETAYRTRLGESFPQSPHRAQEAVRALPCFVEDLLELLLAVLPPQAEGVCSIGVWSVPRQCLLGLIADLVRNATPTSNRPDYAARYRQSLRLWSALLQIVSAQQGQELERRSRRWPASLRRRYVTAREQHRQRRWPAAPYPVQSPSLRFKYNTLAALFALHTIPEGQNTKSHI